MKKKLLVFGSVFLCSGLLVGCSSPIATKEGWDDFSSTEQSRLTELGLDKESIDSMCENYPNKCSVKAIEEDFNSMSKSSAESTLRAIQSQINHYVFTEAMENEDMQEYTVDFSRGKTALEEIGYQVGESNNPLLLPTAGKLTVDINNKVTAENIVIAGFHCQYVNATAKFECEK